MLCAVYKRLRSFKKKKLQPCFPPRPSSSFLGLGQHLNYRGLTIVDRRCCSSAKTKLLFF